MDNFDELIKSKIKNEKWETTEEFNHVIKSTLNNLENRKVKKDMPRKIIAAVAVIAILNVTTVFAMTPQGKQALRGVVEFFNGENNYRYLSDKDNFNKFNIAVGVSVEDKGIKVTLDNIAVDDNFLNTFYTIESKDPIKKVEQDTPFTAAHTAPFLILSINGEMNFSGNNNGGDAYFQSDKVMKVMQRKNISQINLGDTFDLEICTDEIFGKKGDWKISTKADKSQVKVETVSINPNKKATIKFGDFKHDINIDKVTLSPFGNQIVITEKTDEDRFFDKFALYDDKGNSLDVLSTGVIGSLQGKVTNSYEFIKANKDIEYMTLVPIEMRKPYKESEEVKMKLKNEPMIFNLNENGSIVIEEFKYDKNVLKISYKKEGVVDDPSIYFYDENGNKIDLGEQHLLDTPHIDREKGIYTEIRIFKNKDVDLSKIKKIGMFKQYLEMLRDQEIRIDFK